MVEDKHLEASASWPLDTERVASESVQIVAIPDRRALSTRSNSYIAEILHLPLRDFWETLKEPGWWAIGAVGSGVVGNLTYDALKNFALRVKERFPGETASVESIQFIALLAVRARCAEHGLPAPPFATLRVQSCRLVSNAMRAHLPRRTPDAWWEVVVTGGEGQLRAYLRVPTHGRPDEIVESSLRVHVIRSEE